MASVMLLQLLQEYFVHDGQHYVMPATAVWHGEHFVQDGRDVQECAHAHAPPRHPHAHMHAQVYTYIQAYMHSSFLSE